MEGISTTFKATRLHAVVVEDCWSGGIRKKVVVEQRFSSSPKFWAAKTHLQHGMRSRWHRRRSSYFLATIRILQFVKWAADRLRHTRQGWGTSFNRHTVPLTLTSWFQQRYSTASFEKTIGGVCLRPNSTKRREGVGAIEEVRGLSSLLVHISWCPPLCPRLGDPCQPPPCISGQKEAGMSQSSDMRSTRSVRSAWEHVWRGEDRGEGMH